MRKFDVGKYRVNVCQNILEWGRLFYGIPDKAKLDDLVNRQELESECMGFSMPGCDEIWVYVPKDYKELDLVTTVAHEIGHIMKSRKRSPEKKAEHYENFYLLVSEIIENIR